MGELIRFPNRKPPESDYLQCPSCGHDQWVASGVIIEDDGQIPGYAMQVNGEDDPMCLECGEVFPGEL